LPPGQVDKAATNRRHNGLSAVNGAGFIQDIRQVEFHSILAYIEAGGYLLTGESVANQVQYLRFAVGQW
tara:strand:+ start:95 stop:301 length:207 start_codon:yes stop_codon:yes gene_type:complete